MILRNLKNQPFNINLSKRLVRLGPREEIEISDADTELEVVRRMVRARNVALEGARSAPPAKTKKKSSKKGSKKSPEESARATAPVDEQHADTNDSDVRG